MAAGTQSAKQDADFVMDLIEEGQGTGVLMGSFLVITGLVFGCACLAVAAYDAGALHLGAELRGWIFRIAAILWMLAIAASGLALRSQRIRLDRTMFAVTLGLLLAACAYWVAASAIVSRLGPETGGAVYVTLVPMLLCLYGAGWVSAAFLMRRWWMAFVAAAAFCGGWFASSLSFENLYIIMFFWMMLLAVIPGVLLLSRKRLL
jgi:hypothetical protein